MAEGQHRLPIDDEADDALQRLFETCQNLQSRIYRSGRRGFLTPMAVREMQYSANAIQTAVSDLSKLVGLNDFKDRKG